MDLEDRITIQAAEGIELNLQLAGAGSRFIAGGMDLVLQLILMGLVAGAAAALGANLSAAVLAVAAFAIIYGYDVLFEVLAHGQTPGKRLTHLRVVRDQGAPVDLPASATRNIIRVVDGLPLAYMPALICILFTSRNQRPGDIVADTLVIREPRRPRERRARRSRRARRATPAAEALSSAGWDVSAISHQEVGAVRRFLERRASIEPRARRALAERLEQALRPRVAGAPPEPDPERFLEALARAKSGG